MEKEQDEIQIDLAVLFKALWSKAWLIILGTILGGVIAFVVAEFLILPMYESSAVMYVNNAEEHGGQINSTQVTIARNLVATYIEILKSRDTLTEVIEKSGVDYTYGQLVNKISASSKNNTEVFEIVVRCGNPEDAQKIAAAIVEVLPERLAGIVDGSNVRVVDKPLFSDTPVSPSVTKYTAIGMVLGFILYCGVIIILKLMDNTIRDAEYLQQTFNVPVLATIPNLVNKKSKSYGYYKSYGGYDK